MKLILILLLAIPAFALEPLWEYDCADTVPISDTRLYTSPANGSFGVSVDAPIRVAFPRICRTSAIEAYYQTATGQGVGAIGNACYYIQGQTFSVEDTLSNGSTKWSFDFGLAGNACNDWRDTVALCKSDLLTEEWVTHAIDTFFLTAIASDVRADVESFLTPCWEGILQNGSCDTCVFITYCDTVMSYCSDTLIIQRESSWPNFYQVEWFIRAATADSFYMDTLIYVTEGSTDIAVYRSPITFTGTSSSGTATVEGWRSGGMDIYCDFGKVVTAVDSLEIGNSHIPFSFSWTGFSHETKDTLRVWGVTPEDVHSDTTRITRRYVNTNKGTVRYR